ncbi:hypothetical protein [Desmospora activa]|uniref:hypothetical protein n=1 Tax=Desmospora activa TaxID=500615 RepID=UPI0014753CB9|nr:hypothetical protein [Desmospora activa]
MESIVLSVGGLLLVFFAIYYGLLEKRLNQIKRQVERNHYLLREIAKKLDVGEEEQNQKVVELLAQGKKIEAIKEARMLYPHFGLKEAKEYVDAMEKQHKGL